MTLRDGGSLHDVLAEVEGRAAGEAHGEAGILQQVAEQVIVHQVGLCSPGEVVSEVDVEAAAETEEKDMVGLARPGDQSAHESFDYQILRLWGRDFMDDPRIDRAHKDRHFLEVPVDKLRTESVGLCLGMCRDVYSSVIVLGRQRELPSPCPSCAA